MKQGLVIICMLFNLGLIAQVSNSVQTYSSVVNSHAHAVAYNPSNGDTYIGGSKGDSAFVAKLDAANNVVWAKTFATLYFDQVNSTVTSLFLDGDTLVGCGFTQSGNAIFDGGFVFKLNASSGAAYWFRGEITSNMYFSSIISNGSQYIISGTNRTSFPNTDCDYLAISAVNGDPVWQSDELDLYFVSQGINHVDDVVASTELRDGYFYSTGRAYVTVSNQMRAFVIKMNAAGEVIWKKYFMYPENSSTKRFYGLDIEFITDESLILAVSGDPVCSGSCVNFQMGLVSMDTSGTVTWSRLYNHSSPSEFIRYIEVINSGFRIVGQTNFTSATGKNLIVFETDLLGNPTLIRQLSKPGYNCEVNLTGYANLPGEPAVSGNLTITPFSIRNTAGSPQLNQLSLLRVSDLSTLASDCFTIEPTTLSTTTVPPFSSDLFSDDAPNPVTFNLNAAANNSVFENPCSNVNYDIQVMDSSCTSYTLATSATAPSQVEWSNGSTASTIVVSTSGEYTLQVYNPVTCCYFYDTILVAIDPELPTVELTDPGLLCLENGETFEVIPNVTYSGDGILDYLWSDGSGNLTYLTDEPGWVSLAVSNGCSTAIDSIFLDIQSTPAISGDPLYTFCQGQSIIIEPDYQGAQQLAWNNGSSGDQQLIASPGEYWVAALNSCGSDTLFFEVEEILLPLVSLPAAIDTCSPIPVSVTASIQNATSYVWSTGSAQLTVSIAASGAYYITASNQCGQDQDSITVSISQALPQVDIQVPATVCLEPGEQLEIVPVYLNVDLSSDSLLWSTGSQAPSLSVASGGTYILVVGNNCGFDSDTATFSVLNFPEISGPSQVEECVAGSVLVETQISGANTVVWSDGQMGSTVEFSASGTYVGVVSNQCGSDTLITVVQIGEFPVVDLPVYIDTCAGADGFLLNANFNGIGNLVWNTGATSSEIFINNSGVYWVSATNSCGTASDTVTITIDEVSTAGILASTVDPSCELTIQLSLQNCDLSENPTWNTGDSLCWIEVQQSGIYTVSFENSCGVFSDTIEIGLIGEGQLYVPNTFTPNGDEFNNTFSIVVGECYDRYNFMFRVFNRWGEVVFESADPGFEWDGTHKGVLCQDGTYTWSMDLKKMNNDDKYHYSGHVNILK